MRYAISIERRTISEAVNAMPFKTLWRYYRFRWVAKLVVWAINTLGVGRDDERAKFLGETL